MRCNFKAKQLPHKCPKRGAKLKTEKCKFGIGEFYIIEEDKENDNSNTGKREDF